MKCIRVQKVNGKVICEQVDDQQIDTHGDGVDKTGISVLVEKHTS